MLVVGAAVTGVAGVGSYLIGKANNPATPVPPVGQGGLLVALGQELHLNSLASGLTQKLSPAAPAPVAPVAPAPVAPAAPGASPVTVDLNALFGILVHALANANAAAVPANPTK